MARFSTLDKVLGFIGNRVRRMVRKPDIDWINRYLAIGGRPLYTQGFHIIDARVLQEGEYPNILLVDTLVDEIESHRKIGDIIYLHCRVGRGRAPLIAICYLMKYHGTHLDTAINKVRRRRPYTYLNKEQMRFVKDYWKLIKNE